MSKGDAALMDRGTLNFVLPTFVPPCSHLLGFPRNKPSFLLGCCTSAIWHCTDINHIISSSFCFPRDRHVVLTREGRFFATIFSSSEPRTIEKASPPKGICIHHQHYSPGLMAATSAN